MKNKKLLPGQDQKFKKTITIFLFIIASARLIMILFFPAAVVSYDKSLMVVILMSVVYLWLKDSKEYRILLDVYKKLEISQEQLKSAEIDAISSLIEAVEEKDEYTRGHSDRVRQISLAIAEEMGLNYQTRSIIDRASALHDIGKIGISDAVLHKKEKLTPEEWEIIKSHPGKADKILEPLRFLMTERKIILGHHERYDGKGYPNGVKGKEIRLEALILAVADSFDAMNSKRCYREPLSKDNIISEFNVATGAQYSPEVVKAFLCLLEKRPELWERCAVETV